MKKSQPQNAYFNLRYMYIAVPGGCQLVPVTHTIKNSVAEFEGSDKKIMGSYMYQSRKGKFSEHIFCYHRIVCDLSFCMTLS